MNEPISHKVAKIFYILAIVLAFATLLVYAFHIINTTFDFIKSADILNIISMLRFYLPLALAGVLAIEFSLKHGITLQIVTIIIIALIIIFLLFPDVWLSITSIFGK